MFYGRRIKTIFHFQVKFFGCCSIAFRVPKNYYKSLVGAPIDFNITKKYTKIEEDMAFEIGKGLEFFSKVWKQNITILFLLFLHFLPCSFTFGALKTFVVF